MKKRKDLSNLIYVAIMAIVFLLGSCKSYKRLVVPEPKYKPQYKFESKIDFELPTPCDSFMGLKISNYQSSIDTSFNYLEDAIEVFGTPNI